MHYYTNKHIFTCGFSKYNIHNNIQTYKILHTDIHKEGVFKKTLKSRIFVFLFFALLFLLTSVCVSFVGNMNFYIAAKTYGESVPEKIENI